MVCKYQSCPSQLRWFVLSQTRISLVVLISVLGIIVLFPQQDFVFSFVLWPWLCVSWRLLGCVEHFGVSYALVEALYNIKRGEILFRRKYYE